MAEMETKRKNVDLELSFKPESEQVMSKVQREIIEEDLNRFEDIKENDINISTSFIFDMGDKLEASIFFRNGLSNKINFDKVPLMLVDSEGKVIASEIFTLRELGDIPPKSARPWKIFFDKKNIIEMPNKIGECKVVFSKEVQALPTLKAEFENIPDNMDITIQRKLKEYLNSLPLLQKGQVTINNYEVKLRGDKAISITIIVRNGAEKEIKIEKLPVTVYDGENKKICSVILDIDNLKVSPIKAKLYNLVLNFNPEQYSEYDLEKLSVEFKKE